MLLRCAAVAEPRRRSFCSLLTALLALALAEPAAGEARIDAELGFDLRGFAHRSVRGADRFQPSLYASAELAIPIGPLHLVAEPFGRIDALDARRTHADLRQAYLSWVQGRWQVDAGIKRVFWGVTEFAHLVDFVNQIDLVENIDGEDRLGQPMLQMTWSGSRVTFDAFVMSGFRDREFPTRDGRLGLPVTARDAQVDSAHSRAHVDFAARLSGYAGNLDWAISHFRGIDREPRFEVLRRVPEPLISLRHALTDRSALEVQWLIGSTAFKLEYATRTGAGGRSSAAVAGFEHTRVGVLGSPIDLGIVVEGLFDDRDASAPPGTFEHDLAVGLRLTPNDPANTRLLAGVIVDLHSGEHLVNIEFGRRLGARWALEAELRSIGPGGRRSSAEARLRSLGDPDNKLAFLGAEDYLGVAFTRYFGAR